MAATPAEAVTAPVEQVPQWLFAFDAAAMATFRALALVAGHRAHAERVRTEIRDGDPARHPLPLLRATVLEAVRLWPTTPMVLRQSTEDTEWETGIMPAGTGILIFAPFFHRDGRRLEFADRFAPELWSDPSAGEDWPLVPFSRGPAFCPGRNLVLLLSSAMLAGLLRGTHFRLRRREFIEESRPLPATLNHFALRFSLRPMSP
jgi:cytochrome P450